MERIGAGSQRTEELNIRTAIRNVPSQQLQAQYDIRPLSTKYDMMSIYDRRPIPNVEIKQLPDYDICKTFNPGTAQAPWSGFACNINDESRLRNQYFALQRGAGQSCYIPNSNSDMYEYNIGSLEPLSQPFPLLFEQSQFEAFNPVPKEGGVHFFDNHTRQQIKEIK